MVMNPYTYSAPGVSAPGMMGGALSQVHGGGYPGGPSFGIAPGVAQANIGMQNALYGQATARNNLLFNLGLSGQQQGWNRQFNPTPLDFLGLGVSGLGALGQIGMNSQAQDQMRMMGLNPTGNPMLEGPGY